VPFSSNADQPLLSTTREHLNFSEDSLQFSLRQIFDQRFSAGLRYEVSHAKLNQAYAIPPAIFQLPSRGDSAYEGILHTLTLDALASLPNGLFAGTSATWRGQTVLTDSTLGGPLPDENFWQIDLFAGYRSPRRHFESRIGLLNLTGCNYRLDPINAYSNVPRKQTLAVTLRFNF
jgi:hypothetical protein